MSMQTMRFFLIVFMFMIAKCMRVPENPTAVLISKYAKVAKWGTMSNNTSKQMGRSYSTNLTGRSSSNPESVGNQISYQYPVYEKSLNEANNVDVEIVPGIGEVIQDRFQVRPYFGYSNRAKDTPATYLPPVSSSAVSSTSGSQTSLPSAASVKVPTPQISLTTFPAPEFNVPPPSSPIPPPSNLYDSPFTSYNPPFNINQNIADVNEDIFSPKKSPTKTETDSLRSIEDFYASGPISGNSPNNYQIKSKEPMIIPNEVSHFHHDVKSPSVIHSVPHYGEHRPQEITNTYLAPNNGLPNDPPKSINDLYYPPDNLKEQIPLGHDESIADHDGKVYNMDIPTTGNHDFPKYLYDDHNYENHIYEEVPHEITTPAPEKKRVSSSNYSYYYLGRKLWYIPLYFSIYFMFYVTALIIKSIARHKVTLKNEWISANSRSARDFTIEHIEAIENVHQNITAAIDKADKLYSNYVM